MRLLFSIILALILTLTFSAATGRAEDKPKPLSISELPAFTIPKGQVIYQRFCLFCHGETEKGDGQNSFSLKTLPADLNTIVQERNNEQLFAVIQQGGAERNLSPAMPAFEHTLSKQQIRQLIMYLKKIPPNK